MKVDIDELIEKLEEIKADDYVTVELSIETDDEGYKELTLSAVTFESDEPIGYGVLGEADEELF